MSGNATETTNTPDIFHTEKIVRPINGLDETCTYIKFGPSDKQRSILIRDTMGPGSYLDAIEIYGGTKSDNAESLAMVAFRLVEIEQKPVPPFRGRGDVILTLNKLGNDGISAIARAYSIGKVQSEDTFMATAGN